MIDKNNYYQGEMEKNNLSRPDGKGILINFKEIIIG
jgi:hypothetical protein